MFFCGGILSICQIYGYKFYLMVRHQKGFKTRFDVYETLFPQQMLVHKGGQIKNWSGECKDIIPTKLQCQTIQRTLQSPNLQREIIRKKYNNFF